MNFKKLPLPDSMKALCFAFKSFFPKPTFAESFMLPHESKQRDSSSFLRNRDQIN